MVASWASEEIHFYLRLAKARRMMITLETHRGYNTRSQAVSLSRRSCYPRDFETVEVERVDAYQRAPRE